MLDKILKTGKKIQDIASQEKKDVIQSAKEEILVDKKQKSGVKR